MVVLREFLYRRDDLVAQFLQQLEGGEYDEERVTEQTARSSGVGGSVGIAHASVSGERKRTGTSESEVTLRQTPSSRFNRLYGLLDEADAIQPLEALDDAIWDQIGRNEVVEVDAILALPPGYLDMSQAAGISALLPLIETMKALPDELLPETFDRSEADKISSQMPAVEQFAQHVAGGPVPCTFAPAGTPRYKFFAELARDALLTEIADLEGEVTVLAKVNRKIAKGKPETMGQLVPGFGLNRSQRRTSGSTSPLTLRLQHPAAVVTAIGIYR